MVEPIDFEAFIAKNKTLIQNDPQRELLIYPADDVSVSFRRLGDTRFYIECVLNCIGILMCPKVGKTMENINLSNICIYGPID